MFECCTRGKHNLCMKKKPPKTRKSMWLCLNVFVYLFCCDSCPKLHDDVIKWKHFPRNWPFVREIHRSPVNFPHKGQWRGALMFPLIYAWINDWVNNHEAGDLRRQHGHYDVIVMWVGKNLHMAIRIIWTLTDANRFIRNTIKLCKYAMCTLPAKIWFIWKAQWKHWYCDFDATLTCCVMHEKWNYKYTITRGKF